MNSSNDEVYYELIGSFTSLSVDNNNFLKGTFVLKGDPLKRGLALFMGNQDGLSTYEFYSLLTRGIGM